MCLQFGFVFFWRKNFGAKAAHKMLVKLTPGLPLIFQLGYQLPQQEEVPRAGVDNIIKLFFSPSLTI
jgi:hypothetical protein